MPTYRYKFPTKFMTSLVMRFLCGNFQLELDIKATKTIQVLPLTRKISDVSFLICNNQKFRIAITCALLKFSNSKEKRV